MVTLNAFDSTPLGKLGSKTLAMPCASGCRLRSSSIVWRSVICWSVRVPSCGGVSGKGIARLEKFDSRVSTHSRHFAVHSSCYPAQKANLYNLCTKKVACRFDNNAPTTVEIRSHATLRRAALAAMIVENRMNSAPGPSVLASYKLKTFCVIAAWRYSS